MRYFIKPVCLLLLFFISSKQLIAQQKFIEVNVTDTVLAEANLFVYKINILPDEDEVEYNELRYKDPNAYSKKMAQETRALNHIYDSVSMALKKAAFTFISPTIADTFDISQQAYNIYNINILLHSYDSLALLYQHIKGVKYLTGSVEMAKADNEAVYQKLLYQQLLNEAVVKAKDITACINQKIISIVSVIENKLNDEHGGWSAYPPLSSLKQTIIPGWHTTLQHPLSSLITNEQIINKYPLSNSLTVRFQVE